MALIATSFTMEIILLIIGIYFFDGGMIRKFSAIGLFIFGLQTAITSQFYVSDTTIPPVNVGLAFNQQIRNDWGITFALCTMITFAWTFVSIYRITDSIREMGETKDKKQRMKKRLELILEELV